MTSFVLSYMESVERKEKITKRTKRASKMIQKAFFIVFEGLSHGEKKKKKKYGHKL